MERGSRVGNHTWDGSGLSSQETVWRDQGGRQDGRTKTEDSVVQFILSLQSHCPQVPGMGKSHTAPIRVAEIPDRVAILSSLSHAAIWEYVSQMSRCYRVNVGGEGQHPANRRPAAFHRLEPAPKLGSTEWVSVQ